MSELLSIVINSNILRIALLHRSAKGIRVKRLLEKECPRDMVDDSTVVEPEAFAGFLKLQLNGANIHARDAIFTLPADKLMTREVVLPDISDARIRQIVDTNAAEYFPINLDDYVLGFYRIAAVRKQAQDGEHPADGAASAADDELARDADIELTEFEKKEETGKKKRFGRLFRSGKKKKNKQKRAEEAETTEGTESEDEKGKVRERGQIRVMVIAAPNEMVHALYETAEYLHIRVSSIDFIGNSVFRLAALQVGEEPTLTVDISGDHTALTFFDSGDMIMQRNIDFGLDQIVDIVAREKWLSPERADELLRTSRIISEDMPAGHSVGDPLHFAIDMIRRTMMYYTRNRGMQPVEKVLLMGDAVYYRGMRALLEAQLGVSVTSVDQLKGVAIPRTALMHDQAMKFLDNYGAVIEPVGFVSQELKKAKAKSTGRKAYYAVFAAAALGSAVLIAAPTVQYMTLKRETAELKKEVAGLQSADTVIAAYEAAKIRGEDVRNVNGLTASHNDGLSGFIARLEEVRPRGLRIDNFTIDEGEVTMTVLATGKDVVAAMLRALEDVDDVSEIEASALNSYYENDTETVSCTISCLLTNKEKRDYELAGTQEGSDK
ncbi:MAG: pilus assembly protein PilM [Lachnospiraceae bacterium]|nr:pilus assembly protein PilM [Lachnospiraceae bacterium]